MERPKSILQIEKEFLVFVGRISPSEIARNQTIMRPILQMKRLIDYAKFEVNQESQMELERST